MSAPRPFDPPRMSLEMAAVARAFARRRTPLRIGADDVVPAPLPVLDDPVRLILGMPSGLAVLSAPRGLRDAMLTRLDPAAAAAPPEVAALLLELALEPMLAHLQAVAPALAVSLAMGGEQMDAAATLGLACRVDGVESVVRLDLEAAPAAAVAQALAAWPTRRAPLPEIPVPLGVRVMAVTLALDELRGLREGDVVLPDALGAAEALLVANERLAWRAMRDGRMVQVVSARFKPRRAGLEDWMMDEAPSGEDDDAGLESLPVRLAFELGRLEVPLGELEAVGPGHVFELGRDPGESVDLIANGRRIGRGRLVEVGGTIGVQVVWIGRGG